MKNCPECNRTKEYFPHYKHCPECGNFLGKNEYHVIQEADLKDAGFLGKWEESHPSYAQLSFSRRTGDKSNKNTLYGSSIRHQNTISMYVYRSHKVYDKYSENYHGDIAPMIEIEMSQSQFSEAITSLNMGSGVPVTLKSFAGKVMPLCPEMTLRERIDEDIKETFTTLSKRIHKAAESLNDITSKKGALTIDEKKRIQSAFTSIAQEIGANIPFLKQCMDEAIDKSTLQAKGDIEAFWLNRLTSLGLEKLAEIESGSALKIIEHK